MTVDASSSGITVYGTHAQQTAYDADGSSTDSNNGYIPTISERKDMAEKILDWSKANYSTKSNDVHNIWMYLGLGGYVYERGGDDYTTIRDELSNNFLGAKVQEMYDNNSYYPIGIVLFNDIAASYTTGGTGLAQSILEMNNKYRKAYDPNRSPVDGSYINGTGANTVQSVAPGYSSGMKDSNTNAIGWTRCR